MNRYSSEANRLYGVLDRRLAQTEYVAGDSYSVADIAILPWTRTYQRQNVAIEDYPHVAAWREKLGQREAVIAGMKVGAEWREDLKISAQMNSPSCSGRNRGKPIGRKRLKLC